MMVIPMTDRLYQRVAHDDDTNDRLYQRVAHNGDISPRQTVSEGGS